MCLQQKLFSYDPECVAVHLGMEGTFAVPRRIYTKIQAATYI